MYSVVLEYVCASMQLGHRDMYRVQSTWYGVQYDLLCQVPPVEDYDVWTGFQ